jgi:hypothetical protein
MPIDASGFDTDDPDYWVKRSGNFGSENGGTHPNGSSANVDPATGMPAVPENQENIQVGRNPWTTPPQTGGGSYNQYGQYANGGTSGFNPVEKNFYGGQQIAGGMPSPADYQSVQQYSDAAYENSQRYIKPQQNQQNRRMDQEMINRGIDPNSAMGQDQQNQLGMQQADQNNAAAYGAMQFGQGIQDQMFQQEFANQGLAGQMQQGLWNAQSNAAGYELGMGNLNMNQQGQEFNQMMGLEGVDFRNRGYNDGLMQYQDQLTLAMLGMNPVPVGSNTNPYSPYGQQAGYGGNAYQVGTQWNY